MERKRTGHPPPYRPEFDLDETVQKRIQMRAMRHILRLWILLLVASCGPKPFYSGQKSTMGDDSLYDDVVNELFPSVWQAIVPSNARNVVLKFGGTYIDTEMQILIVGLDSPEEKYEVWYIPKGESSVFRQLLKLKSETKSSDPATLASSITVKHQVMKPSTEVEKLAKQLSMPGFPLSVDDGITLDGIYYSFYMRSISNHTHIELVGPRAASSGNPLIKWMAAMRAAFEAQLESQKN